jgi:hypothetical protein
MEFRYEQSSLEATPAATKCNHRKRMPSHRLKLDVGRLPTTPVAFHGRLRAAATAAAAGVPGFVFLAVYVRRVVFLARLLIEN